MSTWTKSTARMPRACAVRNCFQVGPHTPRHGIDPGGVQDLPHRGGSDRVAELDEFALHPPVPPRGVLRRHADHELADRSCRRRPPGTSAAGVVPRACDQPPVPGEQRRRDHHEHFTPPSAWDQPGQCCEPQPVARLVADPADLAAQDRVLMPEHQEFDVLGHLAPGQRHQAAEQTTHEQVGDRNDHSAMIPTQQAAQAGSSNRAPQVTIMRQRLAVARPVLGRPVRRLHRHHRHSRTADQAAAETAGHSIKPAATPLTTLADLTAYASAHGITLTPKTKPAR